MRLKKLTLHGFKSFADRTELNFDSPFTGIVGPNGCGKSNVVDAFKWVLGEQSAKSLRGRQMLDVIFNGSSSRKSSGLAEVALTFETSGQLTEQFGAEITLTRRLYRSGQSDYLVNNKPSRLKDLRDLLMDTGCGVDAYSLIEQGKVDLLLQASNADRRAVLEEAAGISKYKARKKEAQHRLENTEQNLLRINDIITEIEKQLRSVKLQAGKARNYQQYVTQLNEKKSSYYLAEYHNLMQDQGNLRVQLDEVNQNVRDLKVKEGLAESGRSEMDLRLIDLGNQISAVENHLTQTIGQITSGHDTISLMHQRISEQTENLNNARRRLSTSHRQVDVIVNQQKELQRELEGLSEQDLVFSQKIAELQKNISEKEMELAGISRDVESEKSVQIELMRRISQLNNQINQCQMQVQNITAQRQRLANRQNQLNAQKSELEARKNTLQGGYDSIQAELSQTEINLADCQKEYELLHQQADEITRQLASAREKRSALRSRRDLLSDMEAKQQGLDKGAKEIFKLKEQSPNAFAPILGLVADVIKTDMEHARFIETALAGKDQYLIVESSSFISEHQKDLSALTSRINIIAMDLLPPVLNVRDYSGMDGVIGPAIQFVRNEEKFDHLLRVLLAKTLVVKDLNTAFTIRKEDSSGMRFVTLDGELIEADGCVYVGVGKSSGGLISRKSELEALTFQLTALDAEINRLDGISKETNEKQKSLASVQQQLRTKIYELKTSLVQSKTHLANCEEQLRKIAQEEPIILSELKSFDEQESYAITRQKESQEQILQLEQTQEISKLRLEELNEVISQYQMEKQEISESLTEVRIQAGKLAEKRQSLTGAVHSLRQRHQQIMSEYQSSENEIESAQLRIQQAERQILNLESRLASAYLDKQKFQSQSAVLRQDRDSIQQKLQKMVEESSNVRKILDEAQQKVQDLALHINELTVRQETLIQRVQEELGVDVEHAYGQYEYQEQNWAAVENEINDLKGKIARLGNVNIDSIAEHEQLEARDVFLTSQQKDLLDAKEKLQELIGKLDEESAKRFVETFDTVRTNFQDIFRKLFGGGKADMVLDNPDDVLESGIDIMAKPPGKETRSVSLLSGGEKTLTTVALLMAIFKSKPSPFCILDEVDAALDEANVDRFNLVIREFMSHSQFIVVTHNKRTMSYANVLYGITMQEAGISKRVAVKFDDKSGSDGEKEGQEAA